MVSSQRNRLSFRGVAACTRGIYKRTRICVCVCVSARSLNYLNARAFSSWMWRLLPWNFNARHLLRIARQQQSHIYTVGRWYKLVNWPSAHAIFGSDSANWVAWNSRYAQSIRALRHSNYIFLLCNVVCQWLESALSCFLVSSLGLIDFFYNYRLRVLKKIFFFPIYFVYFKIQQLSNRTFILITDENYLIKCMYEKKKIFITLRIFQLPKFIDYSKQNNDNENQLFRNIIFIILLPSQHFNNNNNKIHTQIYRKIKNSRQKV